MLTANVSTGFSVCSNILKDLNHEHIVRYVDRYVDRDAGILYILMEFCGGGDLSGVIKQAQRHGRPIPEDTVWNYFMQILLALNHCHHPQGSGRQSSGGSSDERDRGERRPQILHRDLKPDNGAYCPLSSKMSVIVTGGLASLFGRDQHCQTR